MPRGPVDAGSGPHFEQPDAFATVMRAVLSETADVVRTTEELGRTWKQLAQNRFWLIVPMLALDVALVGRLPPPLAPGSPGPWSWVPRC